ncbi:MAG TPA: hypothetical protein VGK58_08815 [Lacipirellulaceae bacterium]
MGIIVSGTRPARVNRESHSFVAGDCLILFIPSLGNTASSLFRPRRDILAVFDGVFYLIEFKTLLRTSDYPLQRPVYI